MPNLVGNQDKVLFGQELGKFETSQQPRSPKVQNQNFFSRKVHTVEQGAHDVINSLGNKLAATLDKIESFIYQNKGTFLFIGSCVVIAHFSPLLFFPAAITGAVLRIEATRKFKAPADHYLKDALNPFKSNQNEKGFNSLEIALGAAAALDAVAKGTLFFINPLAVLLLPAAVGLVAGNAIAKWEIKRSNLMESETAPELKIKT